MTEAYEKQRARARSAVEVIRVSKRYQNMRSLAHLLKNRLLGVRLRLDGLAEHAEVTPAVAEELRVIADQVERAKERCTMSDPTKLDQMMKPSRCDVHNLCDSVARGFEFEHLIDIELRTDELPTDGEYVVWASESLLRIALENLLQNSAKAMPEEPDTTRRILIRITREAGQDSVEPWIVVNVEDAGPGVPPEIRERFAERAGPSADAERSGQGLWDALTLVEYYSGTVNILDEPSDELAGAHLEMRLPAAPPAASGILEEARDSVA